MDNYSNLLLKQYRGKPKASWIIDSLTKPLGYQEIELINIAQDVDIATGEDLDKLGFRLGLTRYLDDYDKILFFGFNINSENLPFLLFDQSNYETAGKFYFKYEKLRKGVYLDDISFRELIYITIIKQANSCSLKTCGLVIAQLLRYEPNVTCNIYKDHNNAVVYHFNKKPKGKFINYILEKNNLYILASENRKVIINYDN